MFLAEELALVAIDVKSGRHALGTRDQLNACLAGLLMAELVVDGAVAAGEAKATIVLTASGAPTNSALLSAVADVVAEKGPKMKAVLAHMSRGLAHRLGAGTWDAVIGELVNEGVAAPPDGGLRSRVDVIDRSARDAIIDRLRGAASGDDLLDARTACLLSMTGPAHLLEIVAPDRATRKHARKRIDHALDSTQLQPVGEAVRRLLAEAAAAAAAAATVAATAG